MEDVVVYEAQNHLFAPLNFRPKERLISTMLSAPLAASDWFPFLQAAESRACSTG